MKDLQADKLLICMCFTILVLTVAIIVGLCLPNKKDLSTATQILNVNNIKNPF